MKYAFVVSPTHGRVILEQDTKVTVEQVRDVKVEAGDMVSVLMQARVERVVGNEVDLRDLTPVKVVGVRRAKK